MLAFGLSLTALLAGYVYIFSSAYRGADDRRVRSFTLLLLAVTVLYCTYLYAKVYWIVPRGPAVGEEADLGVIVFLAAYVFAPLLLCLYACGRLGAVPVLPGHQESTAAARYDRVTI